MRVAPRLINGTSCVVGTLLGSFLNRTHSKGKAKLGFWDVSVRLWGPKDSMFFILGTFLSKQVKLLPRTDHSLLIMLEKH